MAGICELAFPCSILPEQQSKKVRQADYHPCLPDLLILSDRFYQRSYTIGPRQYA